MLGWVVVVAGLVAAGLNDFIHCLQHISLTSNKSKGVGEIQRIHLNTYAFNIELQQTKEHQYYLDETINLHVVHVTYRNTKIQ